MSTLTTMTIRVVGRGELVALLGVSRARAVQISVNPKFPVPLAALTMGYVWDLHDVAQWAEKIGRQLNYQALEELQERLDIENPRRAGIGLKDAAAQAVDPAE